MLEWSSKGIFRMILNPFYIDKVKIFNQQRHNYYSGFFSHISNEKTYLKTEIIEVFVATVG